MNKELLRHVKMPLTVVFLHLITFPPIGFYLIYRKVVRSSEYEGNNRAMKFCGWISISLAIVPSIIGLLGNDIYRGNIGTYFVMWLLPGLYTLFRANRITKYLKDGTLYDSASRKDNTNSNNTSAHNTVHNIHYNYSFHNTSNKATKYKVITCSGCGAKKSIPVGSVDTCDFCDAPLQADECNYISGWPFGKKFIRTKYTYSHKSWMFEFDLMGYGLIASFQPPM